MNKEKVQNITDLPASNKKRALVWGGTAVAGVAALLLIANSRKKTADVTDEA